MAFLGWKLRIHFKYEKKINKGNTSIISGEPGRRRTAVDTCGPSHHSGSAVLHNNSKALEGEMLLHDVHRKVQI